MEIRRELRFRTPGARLPGKLVLSQFRNLYTSSFCPYDAIIKKRFATPCYYNNFFAS